MTEIAGDLSPGESRRPSRAFDNCSLATPIHTLFSEIFEGACVKYCCPPAISRCSSVSVRFTSFKLLSVSVDVQKTAL